MKIFTENLGFPEAPVAMPDGSFLFVEMAPEKGWITQVSADGSNHTVLAKTGRPNGLARDRNGVVWIAETAQRAVLRMDPGGKPEIFADRVGDERFLFLNDLAFAPNGDLYVTDSGILMEDVAPGGVLAPNWRDLEYDGRVYRIDVRTREVECIDRGLQFTNGVAFGPDNDLYVTETLTGNIYRYACRDGRAQGKRILHANVIERFDPAQLKGPDGIKFASDGSLFVAVFGQGDVTVLDPQGKVSRRIPAGGLHPTNIAFGPNGSRAIYVTEVESGSVRILDAGVDGFPLYG
jgi:gluconolactonase